MKPATQAVIILMIQIGAEEALNDGIESTMDSPENTQE